MLRSVIFSRPAKLFISIALIAAVIWQVGPHAVVPETIRWSWIVVAIALFLLSNIFGAFQWNLLLRCAGLRLPVFTVIRAYFIALFFNNFLIGNVGGDVLRAIDVRTRVERGQGKTEAAIATIVMDRFLGFFTMMCFAVGAALFATERLESGAILFILLAAFVVVGTLITSRRVGLFADRWIIRILPARLAVTIVRLRAGFVAMRTSPVVLAQAFAISAFVQGIRIIVHYVCSLAIGLDIPFLYFVTFIPLVSVAAAIPISFGGLGTREWAAVGLFKTVGVGGAGIVAMELIAHGVTLVASLPGAIDFVTRKNTSRDVSKESI
ncbi:MAG TPA: flippase-like domain-containing protein [Firmicutes bacterium]|nr:flippase-like domain-containing protein [Bacillota bacterium]